MTSGENRRLAEGRNGIHKRLAFGCHFEFVPNGSYTKMLGRCCIRSARPSVLAIVATEHWAQRLAINPFLTRNAVVGGRSSRSERRRCRSQIGVCQRIFRLCINAPFAQEFLKTFLAIKRHKGLKIIRAQLVNKYVHHHARHPICRLTSLRRRERRDGKQERQQQGCAMRI